MSDTVRIVVRDLLAVGVITAAAFTVGVWWDLRCQDREAAERAARRSDWQAGR